MTLSVTVDMLILLRAVYECRFISGSKIRARYHST